MSSTQAVTHRDRSFWALDDAAAVWLAYLVDELDAAPADDELATTLDDWRVATFISDYGITIPVVPEPAKARLMVALAHARSNAVAHGDVSIATLKPWTVLEGRPVSGGFSRRGESVQLPRILEVGDAFIALLDGTLPADPAGGWWFLGTGEGFKVIAMKV